MNFLKSIFKSPFVRTLAHAAASAAIVSAAASVQSGAPLTSGNVLIPAAVAGAMAVLHAVAPSTFPKPDDEAQ